MVKQRLIQAIGRIERALSRIEQAPLPQKGLAQDAGLQDKHDRLKLETKAAISEIDRILSGQKA
ncbi:MAG: hypothetical protein WBO17_05300 [Sphingorhabdus sp.]